MPTDMWKSGKVAFEMRLWYNTGMMDIWCGREKLSSEKSIY